MQPGVVVADSRGFVCAAAIMQDDKAIMNPAHKVMPRIDMNGGASGFRKKLRIAHT